MLPSTNEQFTLKWQLKFVAMICFTGLLFVMKIVTGQMTRSMALVADSFHMITDFAALTIGFIALRLANSRNSSSRVKRQNMDKFTFGWVRAEVLGGLINTVFLLALCFAIMVSAFKRFVQPEHITKPVPVLIVGSVSLLVNFIGLLMFRTSRENCWSVCTNGRRKDKTGRKQEYEGVSLMSDEQTEAHACARAQCRRGHEEVSWEQEYRTPHNLNIRGVYLHILEHFLVSMIVIVSALLVICYERESWVVYIDPAFTTLVVITILYSTVPLFRETLVLFMQSVPANIKLKDMEERLMKKIPEVLSLHEFHVWQLAGDQVVGSVHVLYKNVTDFRRTADKVKSFFRNEGIACMTFQPEFLPVESATAEEDNAMVSFSPNKCYFRCSDKDCETLTCCALGENEADDITSSSIGDNTEESSVSPEISSLISLPR